MFRITLGIAALLSTGLLAACGDSSGTATPTATFNPSTSAPSTSAPATSAPASTSSAAATQVAGTWSGQYSGVYSGTFALTWQQTGSNVNGSIKLSSPAKTYSIDGTLSGSSITFGAVGVVTYTGSVTSSTMMSGTYQTPNGGSGNWSATKS